MAGGGTYRYRRDGQLERAPGGALRQLPQSAYEQPKYINSLNGGVARTFDPLEPGFCAHDVFLGLIDWLAALYDPREGHACHWNIRLHPYRIVAGDDTQGRPTPEDPHRDGVDYIVSLLRGRRNVTGSETPIHPADSCSNARCSSPWTWSWVTTCRPCMPSRR